MVTPVSGLVSTTYLENLPSLIPLTILFGKQRVLFCASYLSVKPDGIVRGKMDIVNEPDLSSRWTIKSGMHRAVAIKF